MSFLATNPATGEFIRSLPFDDDETIRYKLALAKNAFQIWRKVSLKDRTALLFEAGKILLADKESYAQLMVEEMGKPISAARAEIDKCALVCDYYVENAERFLAPIAADTSALKSYASYEPMGAILAVMPWNFPFWQVFRFAAPTITAGNICLLKHAPSVPGCAVAIDDIFIKAGFPEDVLTPLYIDIDKMETVISNPIVKGVSLTGSTRAGASIAQLAGKYIKKSVLELGGSDPFIILEDADIQKAAAICAKSRLKNAGQSCIGAKRIIVVEKVYDAFLKAFQGLFEQIEMADPSLSDTQLGPMSREELRNNLHSQVLASIAAGAECTLGAYVPEENGAWYPPTILTNIEKGCPAYSEELFGPVASIIKVKDEEEALEVANDTSFGLGAAVFTANLEKGEHIAREELQAGACFVNEMVKSDPRLPFGGINNSGYGRELSSMGMYEFMNIKTVWVGHDD